MSQKDRYEELPDLDLPDIEQLAHSATQEALSFGLSHDVIHRWMHTVMTQTAQAVYAACQQANNTAGSVDADSTPNGTPSNVELRGLWYGAGGTFHGPRVETGSMAEAKLLPFLRTLINSARQGKQS